MEEILKTHIIIKDEMVDGVKVVYVEKKNVNPLKKYYDSHKEEISKQKSEKFKERYYNDEEYREKVKAQRRENYLKNKLKVKNAVDIKEYNV
jgi:hypothetical protein